MAVLCRRLIYGTSSVPVFPDVSVPQSIPLMMQDVTESVGKDNEGMKPFHKCPSLTDDELMWANPRPNIARPYRATLHFLAILSDTMIPMTIDLIVIESSISLSMHD